MILVLMACTKAPVQAERTVEVVSIRLTPEESVLHTGAGLEVTEQFFVEATLADGEIDPAFDLVDWSVTNTLAGSVDDSGLFTASDQAGGRTLLTAEVAGFDATAEVTVIFDATVLEDELDQAASDAFAAVDWSWSYDAGADLRWAYPPDGVALPRNLPEMEFMWADELGLDVYEVSFDSSTTHVTKVTTEPSWLIPRELWSVISATNSGDEVSVTLRGLRAAVVDGVIGDVEAHYELAPIRFRVSRFDAEGAVYYWSTTDQGIVRAAVDETTPEVWFANTNETSDGCVGCHVLSRDGDRVAYTWSSLTEISEFRVGLAEIVEGAPELITEMDSEQPLGRFSTIDPTGTWRISDEAGILTVYDAWSGENMGDLELEGAWTMPDWAPDGHAIVAVRETGAAELNKLSKGEIAVMEHLGNAAFGEPEVLVPFQGANNYYPTWSPDSKWIAFNQAQNGTNYFNVGAKLNLVSAAGGEPIKLSAANDVGELTNSWPRWGPLPDDDILWLAFASTRQYGTVPWDDEFAQVWVAGIDTYAAEDGLDPSYPAFRLVQQDLETSNHTPWWSY